MALYVDCAYLEDISALCSSFPIHGVTMNPTILLAARERGQRLNDMEVLSRVLRVCDGPVFMQPMGDDADELRALAEQYIQVATDRVVPKLPMTPDGLRVGMALKRQGARYISFTAVYSLAQAYSAALAGADWAIPYVGRLRRAGVDPLARISQMSRLLATKTQQPGTRILAASVKSPEDIVEATLAGADDITAPPDVIRALATDPLTDAAFAQFAEDWRRFRA